MFEITITLICSGAALVCTYLHCFALACVFFNYKEAYLFHVFSLFILIVSIFRKVIFTLKHGIKLLI